MAASHDNHHDNDDLQNFVVFTVPITLLGTVTNCLSLCYFITKINRSATQTRTLRKADSITPKLFLVLNVFDFFVIVSTALKFFAYIFYRDCVFDYVSTAVFQVSIIATSFLTCLLAVIRAINVKFPFYLIKWRLVKVSIVVFSLFTAAIRSLALYRIYSENDRDNKNLYRIEFLILGSLFLLVVAANLLAMAQLGIARSQAETQRATRKATITVALISGLYCVCNIGFLVTFSISQFTSRVVSKSLVNAFFFILLPLNSACNPGIYLLRTADMRAYLLGLPGRFTGSVRSVFSRLTLRTTLQSEGIEMQER